MTEKSSELGQGLRVVKICGKRQLRTAKRLALAFRQQAKPKTIELIALCWRLLNTGWQRLKPQVTRIRQQINQALSQPKPLPQKPPSTTQIKSTIGAEHTPFEETEVAAHRRKRVTSHDSDLERQVVEQMTAERSFERAPSKHPARTPAAPQKMFPKKPGR